MARARLTLSPSVERELAPNEWTPNVTMRTVLVERVGTGRASYQDDWAEAIRAHEDFECATVELGAPGSRWALRKHLERSDVVILMHSVLDGSPRYLEAALDVLGNRSSQMVAFVGNEVSLPGSSIGARRAVLQRIAPEFIVTQLLPEAGEYLWEGCSRFGVVALPHALNEQVFVSRTPIADRPIGIGIRSYRYPVHIGDDDRNRLLDLFGSDAMAGRIHCDVSDERLTRHQWANFLDQSRGTAATEAGSWYLKTDDSLVEEVRHVIESHRMGPALRADSWLRYIFHRVPTRLRRIVIDGVRRFVPLEMDARLSPEAVREIAEIFERTPLPPVYGKCISSRNFDAIGTRTCQILLEGRFNDILAPGSHYLELANDFSNLDQVLQDLKDDEIATNTVDAALEHVTQHHLYRHRARDLAAKLFQVTKSS